MCDPGTSDCVQSWESIACVKQKSFLFPLMVEERVAEIGFSHFSLGYSVVKTIASC